MNHAHIRKPGYFASMDFIIDAWEWAKRQREITPAAIMAHFGVSRPTAYRWANSLRAAREKYREAA